MFRKFGSLVSIASSFAKFTHAPGSSHQCAFLVSGSPRIRWLSQSQPAYVESSDLFDNIDYDAITNGDPELLKKLKLVILELDVSRQEGLQTPSKISTDRWRELLEQRNRTQRIKLLRFLYLNEKRRENDKEKKLKKRQEKVAILEAKMKETADNDHIVYGFAGSTIFLRIYDSTIDKWHNARLIQAMMFGQPLVIDCSYDEHMTPKEANNTATQLSYVFADNRSHASPFNLYFCNARKDSRTITRLHKSIPPLYDDDFPVNISEKSYLDFFPKERLVYLTPHCRQELQEYNHDDVYIVGAMVDRTNCEPLSLAKAKAEGLRMAKLPLDRNLDWNLGTKSLTINQVVAILLDLKVTNCWKTALRHVPKRKIKDDAQLEKESKRLVREPRRGYNKQERTMLRIRELYS